MGAPFPELPAALIRPSDWPRATTTARKSRGERVPAQGFELYRACLAKRLASFVFLTRARKTSRIRASVECSGVLLNACIGARVLEKPWRRDGEVHPSRDIENVAGRKVNDVESQPLR